MKEISPNFNIGHVPGALESNRAPTNATKSGPEANLFKDQLAAFQNGFTPSNISKPTLPSGLKFSNHAIDRMQARGVRFSPEQLGKIESAVIKAESKGAKNTLLLTDAAAMIVSIKDKTVVTVMDKANLKENVFTNIDSTVVV